MRAVIFFLVIISIFSCQNEILEEGSIDCSKDNLEITSNKIAKLSYNQGTYFLSQIYEENNDELIIKCTNSLELPSVGSIVLFSGRLDKKNIYLEQIEVLEITKTNECIPVKLSYNKELADPNLNILASTIENNCLTILVGFQGNCTILPKLQLSINTELIGFGSSITLTSGLEGAITKDCETTNYIEFKYDLIPLRDKLKPLHINTEYVILYFIAQQGKQLILNYNITSG